MKLHQLYYSKIWCVPRKGPLKSSLRKFSPICYFPAAWSHNREWCCLSWSEKAFKVGGKSGWNVCKLSTFTARNSCPKTAVNRKLYSAFFSLYLLLIASHLRGCPLKVIAFRKKIRNCFRKSLFFQMTLLRWGCFFFYKSVSPLISSLCS